MAGKDFDIVIHGASGSTGRLVAEVMAVRDEIGAPADTPMVVTDTQPPSRCGS